MINYSQLDGLTHVDILAGTMVVENSARHSSCCSTLIQMKLFLTCTKLPVSCTHTDSQLLDYTVLKVETHW